MKTPDVRAAAGQTDPTPETAASRLAALERLIAYARDEAEKLKVDVLVFCLDASLTVARGEMQRVKIKRGLRTRRQSSGEKKVCH